MTETEIEQQIKQLRQGRELPKGEVGCKICNKSIYRIFVEHIEEHLGVSR